MRTLVNRVSDVFRVIFRTSWRRIDGPRTPFAALERTVGTAPYVCPRVRLHDKGTFDVVVSFGTSAPVRYRASFDDSDERAKFCNVESDLFMALSNLAHKKYGDCTIYQMEMMSIIGAYANHELRLELPAKLAL